MSASRDTYPCLKNVFADTFRATAQDIALTLEDAAGDTGFDLQHCRVLDITDKAKPPVPVSNVRLTAKEWAFALAAGREYRVQAVFAQVPAIGCKANLLACRAKLMTITESNQIQTWAVVS